MLRLAQAESFGQSVHRCRGRGDRPALFQTDVPVDSNARTLRDLLPPQPGGATPLFPDTESLRGKLYTARPQKISQFTPRQSGELLQKNFRSSRRRLRVLTGNQKPIHNHVLTHIFTL